MYTRNLHTFGVGNGVVISFHTNYTIRSHSQALRRDTGDAWRTYRTLDLSMLTGEQSVKVAVSANIWDDVMTGCKMHRTVRGFIKKILQVCPFCWFEAYLRHDFINWPTTSFSCKRSSTVSIYKMTLSVQLVIHHQCLMGAKSYYSLTVVIFQETSEIFI